MRKWVPKWETVLSTITHHSHSLQVDCKCEKSVDFAISDVNIITTDI